jgi:hypothetical protein
LWEPTLVDYLSVNEQLPNDNTSVGTRFKTTSNKLSNVNYSKQGSGQVKKYRPKENLSKIHTNTFTAVLRQG